MNRKQRQMRTMFFVASFALLVLNWGAASSSGAPQERDELHTWSLVEVETLRSLWIGSLPSLPKDPSNKYSDSLQAAALGEQFFNDTRFSGNLKISCATCHPSNSNFADNLPRAHGMGITTRRTMPLIGVGYNSWFFWDGRTDSLWAQALGPPESRDEHGITRTFCAHLIIEHYRDEYEEVFGPLPEIPKKLCPPIAKPDRSDPVAYKAWISMPQQKREEITRIYVNMGKAIAAYVRRIVPGPARFDRYVEELLAGNETALKKTLNTDEVAGLKLFIGKAQCINCHNGPLFTNGEFHNIDVPQPPELPQDRGRADGIKDILKHEFNCLSTYSDAKAHDCAELRFIDRDSEKYAGAFKTPSLRNVVERAPYMHAGQLATLRDVLVFYDVWPEFMGSIPELEHTDLTDRELRQIEAFLGTLSGPVTIVELDQQARQK